MGAVPVVTMAQGVANWRNTHTHVDRTLLLSHLHQHSYNHMGGPDLSFVVRGTLKAIIN